MENLSQKRRLRMLSFLEVLRKNNQDDVSSLRAINEIEQTLKEKKYGLVWEEHTEHVDTLVSDNILIFNDVTSKTIRRNASEAYNFLLEGDNLHSLKLLEKTHRGKIDIIYIDPPYNRGKNDFIYDDNYIVKEDGYRHSKWLSFMHKRLSIAYNLLKKDGLIFISIDDNESAQLRLLMDEVFGVENFINCFVWKRNSSVKTEKDKFTINTEYVLLYSKTRNFTLFDTFKPLSENTRKMYSKNDNDGRGFYRLYPLQKPRDPGPETTYDYTDNNGKVWPCPKNGWRMSQEKLKALENDGRLCLDNTSLSEKAYWNERKSEGKRIDTMWDDLPENSTGSSELERAIGKQNTFENPKPTKLISRCLEISHKDALVLDFFAGSGTTGHAVQLLNQIDGGNRRYILCTNNENNICEEVTYQRLLKIQDDLPHNLKYFRTGLMKKNEDIPLTYELLEHIKPLVELEYACDIDEASIGIFLTEDDFDQFMEEDEELTLTKVFLASDILLSSEQLQRLNNVGCEIIRIPEYYYRDELIETGDI